MKKKTPRTGLRRRDATGHLDPRYAAELLEQGRENQTSDPPPSGFVNHTSDDLAEDLAEDFVRAATSAEDGDNDAGDELITGELNVPEGDDDDLAFDTGELKSRRATPTRTQPKPARARKASKRKAKQPRASKAKAKAKAKPAKSKTAKVKAVKARAKKTKPSPKKSKRARKA